MQSHYDGYDDLLEQYYERRRKMSRLRERVTDYHDYKQITSMVTSLDYAIHYLKYGCAPEDLQVSHFVPTACTLEPDVVDNLDPNYLLHFNSTYDLFTSKGIEDYAAQEMLFASLQNQLTEQQYAIFSRLLYGWKTSEIAEDLGMDRSSVRTQVERSTAKIRENHENRLDF